MRPSGRGSVRKTQAGSEGGERTQEARALRLQEAPGTAAPGSFSPLLGLLPRGPWGKAGTPRVPDPKTPPQGPRGKAGTPRVPAAETPTRGPRGKAGTPEYQLPRPHHKGHREGGDPESASSRDPNTKWSQVVGVSLLDNPRCLKKTFLIFLPRHQGRTASKPFLWVKVQKLEG